MSADNGVYIHKFRNGYAVTHAQAIENIYWQRGDKKYNYRILCEYFKNAPRFKTETEALKYASRVLKKLDICEYGISFV